MARRVVWSDGALGDVEQILEYIGRDSRYYAAAFGNEVLEAARSLKQFAKRGRIVPEYSDPRVRELFVRKYRLIYRVSEDTVEILAFVHGARDLGRLRE